MRTRRPVFLAVLLVACLTSPMAAGCRRGQEAIAATPRSLHVNLPRLQLVFDEQGEPSILGIRLTLIQRILPIDLSMLRLPPEQVQQLMSWNLQHVELSFSSDGLFLFANNKALPHVAWDAQSLSNLGSILDKLGFVPPLVARYVPLSRLVPAIGRGLGIGFVVKFPVAPGQEPVKFKTHPDGVSVEVPPVAEESPLIVHVSVEYDQEGQPVIEDIRVPDIGQLTGQALTAGSLTPASIETLQQLGLQSLLIRMEARGLVVYVNGGQMPYLSWADEHFVNLVDLVEASNLDDTLPDSQHIMELLRSAVPGIREADIELSVDFPASP